MENSKPIFELPDFQAGRRKGDLLGKYSIRFVRSHPSVIITIWGSDWQYRTASLLQPPVQSEDV